MRTNIIFLIKNIIFISLVFGLGGCTVLGIQEIPLEELKEKYANEESKFVSIKGTNIHYRDEGPRDAPVLILMHGVLSSLHTWDGWLEVLENKYRVIRFDVPGYGLTGPISGAEFSNEFAVDFLDQFVTALDLDEFYLAGNSLGGYIAWNYSLVHPKKVKKMVLLDPVSYEHDMPFIMALLATPILGDVARYTVPKFMVNMNVRAVYGDADNITQATYDRYHEMILRPGNRDSMVDLFGVMKTLRDKGGVGDEIKNITVPTLLMWGEEDTWVPLTVLARWKEDLPGVESIVYPGLGHVSMEESPVITAKDADKFFSAPDPSLGLLAQ